MTSNSTIVGFSKSIRKGDSTQTNTPISESYTPSSLSQTFSSSSGLKLKSAPVLPKLSSTGTILLNNNDGKPQVSSPRDETEQKIDDSTNLTCQTCGKQLDVDESLEDGLNEEFFATITKNAEVDVINNEEETHVENVLSMQNLFLLTSNYTNCFHPLCSDCAQKMIAETNRLIEDYERDNVRSINYCTSIISDINEIPTEDELSLLENQEKALRAAIDEINENREIVSSKIDLLSFEKKKAEFYEERFWRLVSEYDYSKEEYKEDMDSLIEYKKGCMTHLNKLRQTNPINDTFHIWYDGHFATINNLRLGTLSSEPVDWNEINAALGQTCLLINTLARALKITFKEYRIIPMGNNTRIEKLDEKSIYELFDSREITIGRFLWFLRRFDKAMLGVLKCVSELCDHIQASDSSYHLPFPINKDRIGDLSAKKQFNSDEGWTRSMKYLLGNLKSIVTWVTKRRKYLL